MQEIKLKAVYINDTNAQKEPLFTKKGEPYKRVVIESESGNKASMNIFSNNGIYDSKLHVVSQWKAGDTVNVELSQSGSFLNFDISTQDAVQTPVESHTEPPTAPPEQHVVLTRDEYESIMQKFADLERLIVDTCTRKESNFGGDPDVQAIKLIKDKFSSNTSDDELFAELNV